jgi:hypothetical protein
VIDRALAWLTFRFTDETLMLALFCAALVIGFSLGWFTRARWGATE